MDHVFQRWEPCINIESWKEQLNIYCLCVKMYDTEFENRPHLCLQTGSISLVPLSVCSASITASKGGGSIALARNWPIPPSRSSLMLKAISCSGVRNISGVIWVSSLETKWREREKYLGHVPFQLVLPIALLWFGQHCSLSHLTHIAESLLS